MSEINTTFQPKGQKVQIQPNGVIAVEGPKSQPVDKEQKVNYKGSKFSLFPTYSLNKAAIFRQF